MTPANYVCELILESNDPLQLIQTIPVTFEVTGTLETVSNLTLTAGDGEVYLKWEPVPYDAVYMIYRSEDCHFPLNSTILIGQTIDNRFIDESGLEGKSYFYKVLFITE